MVGRLMKELNIKGDYLFHHEFKTGKKGFIQRYAYASVPEIYKRLAEPLKYGISEDKAIFWRKRIKKIPTKGE